MKHFYSHLVELDSLYIALDLLTMEDHERKELIIIIEDHVHHVVLEMVLSNLPHEDKKTFLSHVASDNHEEVWKLLNSKTNNMEKKIKQVIDKLKQDFHKDIVRSKKRKK